MASFASFFSTLFSARNNLQTVAQRTKPANPNITKGGPGDWYLEHDTTKFESAITMMPVQSSNLSAIGYDYLRSVLQISFKAKGHNPETVYAYENVPVEIWNGLKAASSKGRFFWDRIRGRTLPGPFRYRLVSWGGTPSGHEQFISEQPIARAPGGYGAFRVNDPQNNPAFVAREATRDPASSRNPFAATAPNAAKTAQARHGGIIKGFRSFLKGRAG